VSVNVYNFLGTQAVMIRPRLRILTKTCKQNGFCNSCMNRQSWDNENGRLYANVNEGYQRLMVKRL